MALKKADTGAVLARTPLVEALAARVRAAAEASIAAFHAAADDRKQIYAVEGDRADHDLLGEIEEVADTLHGYASWALSARPHPERARVTQTLRQLSRVLSFDLPAKALRYKKHSKKLTAYIVALRNLRQSLVDYFAAEVRRSRVSGARRTSTATRRPVAR